MYLARTFLVCFGLFFTLGGICQLSVGNFIYWEGSGTANSSNNMNIPGSRNEAAFVQFPDGKMGISGGFSPYNGYLTDQWKWDPYDGVNGKWILYKGPKTYNELGYSTVTHRVYPGVSTWAPRISGSRQRHGAFYASGGRFAIFGGIGYDSGKEYNAAPTAPFTQSVLGTLNCYWAPGFVDGSAQSDSRGDANHPSARTDFAYVTDKSGDHWIFGGIGVSSDASYVGTNWNFNDMWNITKGQKHSGSNTGGYVKAVYGTTGVESSSNAPSTRTNSVMWCDGNGDIWLFGGWGVDVNGNQGRLNDLWRFNVSSKKWAFIKGSKYRNQNGVYNNLGTPNTGSTPGGRNRCITAVDNSGNLWLYGGYGYASSGGEGGLSDLWHFNVSTKTWTWMGGSNSTWEWHSWSTKKTYVASSVPGTRWEGGATVDTNGFFWLFGGKGHSGQMDDLWKLKLNSNLSVFYSKQDSNSLFQLTHDDASNRRKGTKFGITKVGGVAQRHTYQVQNNGVGILKFTNSTRIELTGAGAADFKIINKPKYKLQYGENSQFTIEFKPKTAGLRQAVLNIYTNSATNPTFKINLSGMAISNELSFDEWNWVHGSEKHLVNGSYTSGSDFSGSPGTREVAASCKDDQGRMWLWGGWGNGSSGSNKGWLNDLWVYDSRKGTWQWVSGSSQTGQAPSYGTKGTAGTSYHPAGKQSANIWYHNGYIYVFGGYGDMDNVTSYSNEFWRYEIASKKWTWLGGGNQGAYYGVYSGAASSNHPGSRYRAASFEYKGKLYLFGGYGYASTGGIGFLNDLWEYDPSTGNWTHISGSNVVNQLGTYGTKGTASSANIPGGRYYGPSGASVDKNGKAYLFGSYGYASSGGGYLNDLWSYDIENDEWVWLSGSNLGSGQASYGTKGVAVSANIPGARFGSGVACDEAGNLWVYGGRGYDDDNVLSVLNDFWKYDLNSDKWSWEDGDKKGFLFEGVYNQDFQDANRGIELTVVNEEGPNRGWWRTSYNGNYFAEVNGYGDVANSKDWLITSALDLSGYSAAVLTFMNVSNSTGGTFDLLVSTNWDGTSAPSTATWTNLNSSANFSGGSWTEQWSNVDLSSYLTSSTYIAWYYTATPTAARTQQIDNISIGGIRNNANGNYSFTGSSSSSAYPGAKSEPHLSFDNAGGLILHGGWGPESNSLKAPSGLNDVWYYMPSGGFIWDGGSSSWATGGNWESSSEPDSTVTVLIPSGKSHYPTISSKTAVKNIYVEENASLSIANGQVLRVKGDLNLEGSLYGGGTIVLCGTGQRVTGSQLGNVRIRLESGDLSLSDDLEIVGDLILKRGDVELGDYDLTLSSSVSGSDKSYIKINGNGKVKTTVGSAPVTIPVGRNPYLPVVIDDGGNAEYTVGVSNGVYDNPTSQATELTEYAVSETWTISSDANVSNVSITLGWEGNEELSNFDRSNSFISYWQQGTSASWTSLGYTSALGSGPYSIQSTMASMSTGSVYYFGIGSSGSALPVELQHFTASWIDSKVSLIKWQTASEQNNSHFEIERSFNGVDFINVGRIEGKGTTYDLSNYQFSDDLNSSSEFLGVVYYRLKQVDYDGKFEFSQVRILDSDNDITPSFKLYPNPTSERFVKISNVGDYELYNFQGGLLKVYHSTNELDLSSIKPGTYLIRSIAGESQILVVK
ncbi:MAG: choice-of-anchor J domain-containing protein [Bacteroidia bacterium]